MVNQNYQYSYVNKWVDPMGTQSSPFFETKVKYKCSLNGSGDLLYVKMDATCLVNLDN